MTIIAVEDDDGVRDVLTRVLEHEGLRVKAAKTGEEALSIIRKEGAPNLLVSDLALGPGMDGISLAQAARLQDPDLAVIFISGRPWLLKGVSLDGNTKFLQKPITMAMLIGTVQTLLIYDRPKGRPH